MGTSVEKIQIEIEYLEKNKDALRDATKRLRSVREEIGMTSKQFQFGYLGTMFYGMQLQRTFGGIQKAGTDTFRQITESTEGASSALGTMAAATEYLNFTVGSALNTALEPLLPTILGIVQGFANFIEQNPKLVSAIVIGGAVVGGLAFQLSQLALAINSVKMLVGAGAGGEGLLASLGAIGPAGILAAALIIAAGTFIVVEFDKISFAASELGKAVARDMVGDFEYADKHVVLATKSMGIAFDDFGDKMGETIQLALTYMAIFLKEMARWSTSGILKLFGFTDKDAATMSGAMFDISPEVKEIADLMNSAKQKNSERARQLDLLKQQSYYTDNPLAKGPYGWTNPTTNVNPQNLTFTNIPPGQTNNSASQVNNYNINVTASSNQEIASQIEQRIRNLQTTSTNSIANFTSTATTIR